MITVNSTASIEALFEQSLQSHLVSCDEDQCLITDITGTDTPTVTDRKLRHLLVINISTYDFRIVALFNFVSNEDSIRHIAKVLQNSDKELAGQGLLDAYGELVNMICGEVNRKLGTVMPHTGMSTPFVLASSCAEYYTMLAPTKTKSIEVIINETYLFRLTICICVAKEAVVDFSIDHTAHQNIAMGELELF